MSGIGTYDHYATSGGVGLGGPSVSGRVWGYSACHSVGLTGFEPGVTCLKSGPVTTELLECPSPTSGWVNN